MCLRYVVGSNLASSKQGCADGSESRYISCGLVLAAVPQSMASESSLREASGTSTMEAIVCGASSPATGPISFSMHASQGFSPHLQTSALLDVPDSHHRAKVVCSSPLSFRYS